MIDVYLAVCGAIPIRNSALSRRGVHRSSQLMRLCEYECDVLILVILTCKHHERIAPTVALSRHLYARVFTISCVPSVSKT